MATARSRCIPACCAAVIAALLTAACGHRNASGTDPATPPTGEAAPQQDSPAGGDEARPDDGTTTRAPDEDRLRLAPPRHPDPQRGAAENLPEIPRDPSGSGSGAAAPPTGSPTTDAGAFQACVDRELARRGLNAYGDPPGTPAREVEDRHRYVTDRYRDIATICGTKPW